MFVFHQQIKFLTFSVFGCGQHFVFTCLCHVCGFVSGFTVTLCRCDLREVLLQTSAVSFHNRDPVKDGVFNWEFG